MQLSESLYSVALVLLTLSGAGMAKPLALSSEDEAAIVAADEHATYPYLMSHKQMMHWITNTDAELTFIGWPPNPRAPRSAQNTIITFCSNVNVTTNTCSGPCTVYTGGTLCVRAPDTNCLAATINMGFCSNAGCHIPCNDLSNCSTRLSDGFCHAPGTSSLLVCPDQ